MGHRREKIGFCSVGSLSFPGRHTKLFVDGVHIHEVHHKQKKQPEGDDSDQYPIFSIRIQTADRCGIQQHPTLRGSKWRMGDDAFPALGVHHVE